MAFPKFHMNNPEDFLYLEESKGRECRGISLHKIGMQNGVTQEMQDALEMQLKDTAQEQFERKKYLGNITWHQALQLNLLRGSMTPAVQDMREALYAAWKGCNEKDYSVYDCSGEKIPQERLQAFLEEVTEVRNPWRAEWLDAKFKKDASDQLVIAYNHRIQNGKLVPQKEEPLENCLMQDKQISLEDWLARATPQGFPPADVQSGSFYYWHPRAGFVALFWAGAGWASLNCSWDPQVSDAALGVFACAAGAQKFSKK